MKVILLVIILFFACYGLINISFSLLCTSKKGKNQYMVVTADKDAGKIEYDIRTLLQKYTDCEIIVINETEDKEVRDVVITMCRDNSRVHMLKSSELADLFSEGQIRE